MAQKNFTITSKGVSRLASQLRRLGPGLEELVEAEIADTALEIERTAAQWVRKDHGFLANSIKATRLASASWKVTAQLFYAPFVEFGTGTMVEIPAGLEQYAKQFMRPRPVKREVNLPARPFFFPAYRLGIANLEQRLKAELKRATQNPR